MVSWLGRLAAYFDLREPFAKTGEEWFGQPTFAGRPRKIAQRDGAMWLLGVYLAELAGVVSKQVWNDLAAGQRLRLQWESLLLASIIATATLPAVYRAVQSQGRKGIRLFLAFQYGFCWQSLFGELGLLHGAS